MNTRFLTGSLIATLVACTLAGCAPQTPAAAPQAGAHPMLNFAVERSNRSERTIERSSRGEAQLARMTPHRSR